MTAHGPADVATHYDFLDDWYRDVWGEHVHHGLWQDGSESPEEAVRALARLVADRAGVGEGARVVDAGCGYGATARLLAAERGASVVGLTLSGAQQRWGDGRPFPGRGAVELRRGDWLANGLPDADFDAAYSIEAFSHMADTARAWSELARVVRPGGGVAVLDWLAAEDAGRLDRRLFLDPICREGRLPGLWTPSGYAELAERAGLEVLGYEDVTARSVRTWALVRRRLVLLAARRPRAALRLVGPANPDRRFGLSLFRIPAAYRLGAMRLGVVWARKPE